MTLNKNKMDEDYVDVEQLSDEHEGGGPLRAKAMPIKESPLSTSHPYKKSWIGSHYGNSLGREYGNSMGREFGGPRDVREGSIPSFKDSYQTAPWASVNSTYSSQNGWNQKTPPNSFQGPEALAIAELERSLFGTEITDVKDEKIEGEMSYGVIVGITDSDGEGLDPDQTDEEDYDEEDWSYNAYAQYASSFDPETWEGYDPQIHGSLPNNVEIVKPHHQKPPSKKSSPKKGRGRGRKKDDDWDDYEDSPITTRPRSSSTGSTNAPVQVGSISSLIVYTNDPNMPKAYQCPHEGCGKLYKNPGGVKYHLAHGHAVFKPYRCIVKDCEKRYRNAGGLRYHIEHAHADQIPLLKRPSGSLDLSQCYDAGTESTPLPTKSPRKARSDSISALAHLNLAKDDSDVDVEG